MAKIRTIGALQDALDREFAWRLKEVSSLKLSVRQSGSLTEATLVRAGVTILYAHWEGFIKASSLSYIDYINSRALKYQDLKSCFAVMGLRSEIGILSGSRKTAVNIAAFDFIKSNMGKTANLTLSNAINTEANLSSTVFANIAISINVSTDHYEPRYKLIDEELLSRRNKIAHGEYLDIDASEWRTLADEIILMMRHFKTDIENAASQEWYKA